MQLLDCIYILLTNEFPHQMEPAAREMLAKDVESHAMQLSGCESSFREANLRCILEMDKRNKAELMAAEEVSAVKICSSRMPYRIWRETKAYSSRLLLSFLSISWAFWLQSL